MKKNNLNRLIFGCMTIPINATERVATNFNIDTPNAQEVTAQMIGHDSWEELESATESEHLSATPDEYATKKEQESRVAYQADVLSRFLPFTQPVLLRKALALRVAVQRAFRTALSKVYAH